MNHGASHLVDPALPQLAILQDAVQMAEELRQAVYGEPTEVLEIMVVRHKPGRRCILRYDLRIGSWGFKRRELVYGKTFATDRGPRVYETIKTIAAAHACGPAVWLPEPLGYLPGLKLLLQRPVAGEPIERALLGGDPGCVELVADAIHALHTSGIDLQRRHDLTKELAPLDDRVERLCARCPSLAAPARRCLALARKGPAQRWSWRWRPIHRDFYHDQVLIGSHGLSLLDFDDAAMSEPAVDIANFTAHLRLLALQRTGNPATLASIAAAFEVRSRALDPTLDADLLRSLEGTTLLRLAEIHLPRARGEWIARKLIEESERLLCSGRDGR